MYYRITWLDWRNQENSIVLVKSDVVKFVAVLLNSLSPKEFTVTLTDQKISVSVNTGNMV